ncbi:outer membrane beta-barrel protein [Altibacter sp.]|uniref:outer membrane beta-barrel protein n=1 Tax=Altibacter sp. TaxID=2024823 RepID=UPI000C927B72|nr:outer membrane beta-barrel protein [Altibacter sp.]MAP55672.1 hypothetical protein [Altibacter sp.]|tara:strand:- start:163 stop:837 length:675 start_codon:yes stop_codon:yes gene_type:complete
MSLRNLLLVTFFALIIHHVHSQRNYEEYNRLGLNGGLTLFDINTDNFETQQGEGFMVGFTTRGSFRNNFDLIYGINFYNNTVKINAFSAGIPTTAQQRALEYTIQSAQINFLGSYNIIKHHLSLEFGPILNVNGKMNLKDETFEDYVVSGYDALTAGDIQDISKINFHVMGGITGGLENFRVSAHYQYGVTNMLGNLNDKTLQDNEMEFEGHSSTIVIAAVIYF